jgi:hypothetical protein
MFPADTGDREQRKQVQAVIKEVAGERLRRLVFRGPPSPQRDDFGLSRSAIVAEEEEQILATAGQADLVGEHDQEEKFPDGEFSLARGIKNGGSEDSVLQLATDLKMLLKERGR